MGLSVKWKITIIFALVFTAVMLVTNYLATTSTEKHFFQTRQAKQLEKANIIATTVANNLDKNIYELKDIIDANFPRMEMRLLYTDTKGVVLMDSFDGSHILGTTLTNSEVSNALKGDSKTGTYYLSDAGWVKYVAVPVLKDGEVIGSIFTSSYVDDIKSAVIDVRIMIFTISIISVIVVIVLSIVISNSLLEPINNLTEGSKKMSMGLLNTRVPVRSNDEIGTLAQNFNSMAEQLEKNDENRLTFLADLSHDLKTPLASIKALAESLGEEESKETYQEFLKDIVTEIDRMNVTVSSLLEFNKVSNISTKVNKKNFIFSYLVDEAVNSIQPIADQKGIKIKFDNKELKEKIFGDREKLRQMILNLLDNAIKYSGENGIVEVKLKANRKEIILAIKDCGKGIPPEALPHLFDRFYRVDKARHKDTGGNGIGLAIVKDVAQLHGGRVDVESRLETGTIFTIKLPKQATLF
ncbi:HAMP domain-containing sensor histidine kinase [Proteinivorax hydrogeniformans]|uniref:histidine kinase n=1 Tax=Proteinivorax hydrogeniformans TaxID=1826727 RepID=A0AAU8HWA8_9FIRM